MKSFRIRYNIAGDHTHMRVYANSSGPVYTHGLCGTLCMENIAFEAFKTMWEFASTGVKDVSVEFLEEK
jgi:hypothetical protein